MMPPKAISLRQDTIKALRSIGKVVLLVLFAVAVLYPTYLLLYGSRNSSAVGTPSKGTVLSGEDRLWGRMPMSRL